MFICILKVITHNIANTLRVSSAGSSPQFGSMKSTVSIVGRSNQIWVEGEGMHHALYFKKNVCGNWTVSYNNRFVESKTFKLQKERKKPAFLPAVEGDSVAILAGILLNTVHGVLFHLANRLWCSFE